MSLVKKYDFSEKYDFVQKQIIFCYVKPRGSQFIIGRERWGAEGKK